MQHNHLTSLVRRKAGGSGLGSRPKINPKSGSGRDEKWSLVVCQNAAIQRSPGAKLTNMKEMSRGLDHDIIKMSVTNSKNICQHTVPSTTSNICL